MSTDLSLVRACLEGDAEAWDIVLSRYRSRVLAFAMSFAKNEPAAQEIASAVWADLYGTQEDGSGRRNSKLASYSGRGSLDGWLRTLVAQAYIDRFRKERRFVSLDESGPWGQMEETSFQTVDLRLEHALDRALSELSGEQRLILAAHFLDGRSFSEIGRMLGLHESSVSRRSNKSIAFLRRRTGHYLRAAGMSMREVEEAMRGDVSQISLDVRKRLQLVRNAS
jgi:RNA polymerase sigma-70 factor, ECF subfamily